MERERHGGVSVDVLWKALYLGNMHTKYEHCTLYRSKVKMLKFVEDIQTDGQTDLHHYSAFIRSMFKYLNLSFNNFPLRYLAKSKYNKICSVCFLLCLFVSFFLWRETTESTAGRLGINVTSDKTREAHVQALGQPWICFLHTWADNVGICTEGTGLLFCLQKSLVRVLLTIYLYEYKHASRSWQI